MIKRNFTKNTYTIARRQHTTTSAITDDYMYIRGVGLLSPSPSIATVETDENSFDLNHEILIKTRQEYPALDNINGSANDYGLLYAPDVVIWTGRPYVTYSQDLFAKQGKDNQRQATLIYDSGETEWRDAHLADPDWSEIDAFIAAVNSVEVVLELKLTNVIK